jgi:trehalose 6-phosphate phosphatase
VKFSSEAALTRWARQAPCLWLFLDYDGTLADFAPTPDHIAPDLQVTRLLERLAQDPRRRVAVISGRKLADVRALVPVAGLFLAGTYGLELQTPSGDLTARADYQAIRPVVERVRAMWQPLIAGLAGFFLEDKGWALALHARFASEAEAVQVMGQAQRAAKDLLPAGLFRMLPGRRFLEVAPVVAHKGETIAFLLREFPWPEARCVYIGDDDKDEEAFDAIHACGGATVWVSGAFPESHPATADYLLASPQAVRAWLAQLG